MSGFGSNPVFGGQTTSSSSLFSTNPSSPVFSSSAFGSTASTQPSSLFRQSPLGSSGFGQPSGTSGPSSSAFSQSQRSVFGQGSKPAFGQTSTTNTESGFGHSAALFGSSTSGFGKPVFSNPAVSQQGSISGFGLSSSSASTAAAPTSNIFSGASSTNNPFTKPGTQTSAGNLFTSRASESSSLPSGSVSQTSGDGSKAENSALFGKPTAENKGLFGKKIKSEEQATTSSARQLFGKPVKDETQQSEGEDSQKAKRGFRTERRLFGKLVPQKKLERISESDVVKERRTSQDSDKSPRTPLQRQHSEDLTRKVSIVCKQVPTKFNNQSELKRHFRRFGHVTKVFPNVNRMQATIHFKTHEDAAEAKRRGRIIARGIPPMSIFWSSYLAPSSPTESSASSVGNRPFSRAMAGPSHGPSQRPQRTAYKDLDAVNDELDSMAGTQDLSGGRASPSKPTAGSQERSKRGPSPVPSTSIDVKTESVSLNQLIGTVARTTTEKVQLLNLRDRYLRQNKKKVSNVDVESAQAFVGNCKDMCPEKERYDREDKRRLSYYEIVPGTENIPGKNPVVDHSRAVKEYIRSSPDQDEPLPHELRPLPVLLQTMTYLLKDVANQGEDGRWADWFDYLWNRTRGIRKDITQQQLCDRYAAGLIEKCARFHIYCSERLCEEDMHSFDAKINDENLTKCLQTLKEFYADLEKKQRIFCLSEAEFRAYTVLMNLNEGDTLREVQKLRPEIRSSSPVRFALDVYFALSSNNYIKFFRLLKNDASFANACIMHRYFPQVRIKALLSMMKGYRPGSKPAQVPLQELVRLLAFESDDEAAGFCSHYGFDTIGDDVILDRNRYAEPDVAWAPVRSKNYIESKLTVTCGEMINGDAFPADYRLLVPHSSFDHHDRLVIEGSAILTDTDKVKPHPSIVKECPVPGPSTHTVDVTQPAQLATQTVEVKPASLFQNVPAELIKDVARMLFWDVIGEMVTVLSEDFMSDVTSTLEQSNLCMDLLVRTSVEEETSKIIREIIAEINAEKLRREAEELEQRKERVSEELVEGVLYDVLFHETDSIAKMEYREVLTQLKKEREERVTHEIHVDYCHDIADSMSKEIAEDVFETDVSSRLQELEKAEQAVNQIRSRRFLEIWKKNYRHVVKLKRAVSEFPATAAMHSIEVQNQKLTGHKDNKVVNNQFLVSKTAKLTVLSPWEILKQREANEYKFAVLDLQRTMQTVLAWQPEDVSKLVCKILQKKIQTKEIHDKSPNFYLHWKMVISLPETPTEKPKSVEDIATKLLSDWFTRKYSFGNSPSHFNSEKSQVLTFTKSSQIMDVDNTKQCVFHLGVCVRTIQGCLSTEDMDVMIADRSLLGTSGMIFVLPAPVVDLQETNSKYWRANRERLQNILEAGRSGQPISLVIVMALNTEDFGKHETPTSVSDNLHLEDFIEANLIFDYHFVEIKFDSSLYQGVRVTDQDFYKKVCESIEWIAERSLLPPSLKLSSLKDFIDHVLIKHFYPPMLRNLKQRKESGYLERNPNSVLELYNSVIDHARYVVTSSELTDLSWPVPEFVDKHTCNLPSKHWNSQEYLDHISDILKYFKLPEFEISGPESWTDAKKDVRTYFADRVKVKSPVIWGNLNCLMRQVEQDFEEKCRQYKGEAGCQPFYIHLPFSRILPLCVEHKMETTDFRDISTEEMGCAYELRVAYNPAELQDFVLPVDWRHQEAEESFQSSPSLEFTLHVAAKRRANERSKRKTKRSFEMDIPNKYNETEKLTNSLRDAIKREQSESEHFIKHIEEEIAKGEAELSAARDLSKIPWNTNKGASSSRRKSDAGLRRKSEEFDLGDTGKRARKRFSEIGSNTGVLGALGSFPQLSLEKDIQNLQEEVKQFERECTDHQERVKLDIEYNEILLKRLARERLHNETF